LWRLFFWWERVPFLADTFTSEGLLDGVIAFVLHRRGVSGDLAATVVLSGRVL
jgi:hypothetical protein